jgi:hypothetical protein
MRDRSTETQRGDHRRICAGWVKIIRIPGWVGLLQGQPLATAHVGLRFRVGGGLCYNRRAVKQDGKQGIAPELRGVAAPEATENGMTATKAAAGVQEDPSRYCPICSQRLESRRCKLVCGGCGYYMSCADYY